MPLIQIPQVNSLLVLKEDWSPELTWAKRNLVLFRHLKLTGQKEELMGQYFLYDKKTGQPLMDDNGGYQRADKYIKRTVPNPLFRDDNGQMVPVEVLFPKGTTLELTKYCTGYNGYIRNIWLKVRQSPDKRLDDRCVDVEREQFNLARIESI